MQDKGHADKRDGWLPLRTLEDLCDILTTIAWVSTGHHVSCLVRSLSSYLHAQSRQVVKILMRRPYYCHAETCYASPLTAMLSGQDLYRSALVS